jgi:homoserine kinase
MKAEAELLNKLSRLAREKHGDNAVEALVGALSSVTTTEQIEALYLKWHYLFPNKKH